MAATRGPRMHRSLGPLDRPVAWFVAMLAIEAVIFYLHVWTRIAPYYPQAFDQLSYIGATQDILREFEARGISALAWLVRSPPPTGITFPVQGALAALLFGFSR